MFSDLYVMGANGQPERCSDVIQWAKAYESTRTVARSMVGVALISTVFLGVDHSYGASADPVLFETMVFWPGHELDEEQQRYVTRSDAEVGHAAMLLRVELAMAQARQSEVA